MLMPALFFSSPRRTSADPGRRKARRKKTGPTLSSILPSLSNFVTYSNTDILPCWSCWNSIAFCLLMWEGTYLSVKWFLNVSYAVSYAIAWYGSLTICHQVSANPKSREAVRLTIWMPVQVNTLKIFSVLTNQSSATKVSSWPENSFGPLFLNLSNNM